MSYNPEHYLTKKESKEEAQKKIREIREKTYEVLKKLYPQLPVDKNLRIDNNHPIFKDSFSEKEIDEDNQKINKAESQFLKNKKSMTESESEKETISSGEALEILKTYLINKHCQQKLICVRTSRYDDIFNQVDNIIIDKENGEILAALDEVADIGSNLYYQKYKKVRENNLTEGTKVKYAITLKDENNFTSQCNLTNVPMVLFALSEQVLWGVIKLDDSDPAKKNNIEINVIKHFQEMIGNLIKDLESEKNLLAGFVQYQERVKEIEQRLKKIKTLYNLLEVKKINLDF